MPKKKMPKWHAFIIHKRTDGFFPKTLTGDSKADLKKKLRLEVDTDVIAIVRGHHKPLKQAVTF